jgi:5-methyltetrahydrofolate--homocysteine methyltransferase
MVDKELDSLRDSIVNLDFKGVEKTAKELMSKGISPVDAIDSLRDGMSVVGRKFENREYFLPHLVVAGAVAMEAMEIIKPHIEREEVEFKGRVVITTVFRDIHDIGKNVVGLMLTAAGFEVIDLGVDVATEKIVEAVREHKPHILALSTLLTMTMPEMDVVIKALKRAGLRKKLKIIIGGAPVTDEYAKKIGADYNAEDAVEGVNKCRQWMNEVR